MTKEQIELKIREILAKDKRFTGAKIIINYQDKEVDLKKILTT